MNKFKEKFKIKDLTYFESVHWIVSVRPTQVTLGSMIISLKREAFSLSDLSGNECKDLEFVFKKLERILKEAFDYDKINYLGLMMLDKQIHLHVLPRYSSTKGFEGFMYEDKYWPGPYDISEGIVDDSLAFKILHYLNKFLDNKYPIIGYTTGVFDLFHIGHLNILKNAKSHCDYLIVGVTLDELVEKIKNKKPVIPFQERIEIIRNLKYVDCAVSQSKIDEINDKQKYNFNIIFKGSDWKGTEKWNDLEKQFKKLDVEIIYFPYTSTTSSTLLRDVLMKFK